MTTRLKKIPFYVLIICLTTSLVSMSMKMIDTKEVLDYCIGKVKGSLEQLTAYDRFPRNIPEGEKHWETVDVRDWTSGFWPGVLWYSYEYTGDDELRRQAEKYTAPLEVISKSAARDHDIGFMMYCSYGNGYRLTGNPKYKQVLLASADTLATLFNPAVGTIHSWPSKPQYPHNTIIDNMMNLELLFWAAKNGGDQRLYDIAKSHAEVTMDNLIREDYSIYHLGSFDDKTGEFIEGKTHQGYADESMWARGQTWGIYGFTICYRETQEEKFLETAQKLADRFIERLPQDVVPYWDFDDPGIPNVPKDASAAAIAASALLELSQLVRDKAVREKYQEVAVNLLDKLASSRYRAGDKNDAILLHSTGHMPRKSEVDVPIVYADYYFMEALLKLRSMDL
ncbi:glucuronyl hydrolase [Echinicola strongylocentroti]|uniref:Glucuronyl hydrolase n=1 Tax=Echinicola strongylocentroti TaxID=1795355 RepID=A0A2Z4IQ47_9BACT|nr:glycoside hydrolase family 88 protein [Echinicola strongylocentroti]AWW32758.1 glucuronyl hydrolase [Echinicola strongylocentroti]